MASDEKGRAREGYYLLLLYVWAHPLIPWCPTRTSPFNEEDRDRVTHFHGINSNLLSNKLVHASGDVLAVPKVGRSRNESIGVIVLAKQNLYKSVGAISRAIFMIGGFNDNVLTSGCHPKGAQGKFGNPILKPCKNNRQTPLLQSLSNCTGFFPLKPCTNSLNGSRAVRSNRSATSTIPPPPVEAFDITSCASSPTLIVSAIFILVGYELLELPRGLNDTSDLFTCHGGSLDKLGQQSKQA